MNQGNLPSRRAFLKTAALSTAIVPLGIPSRGKAVGKEIATNEENLVELPRPVDGQLDLSPARWLWYPSERTLQNTVVLFRREIHLPDKPLSARGWILADSRYRLVVNGKRVQFGPAPGDPRRVEADPLALDEYLVTGKNVIGVEVLFYGVGEGTWTFGKPGLILKLDIQLEGGTTQSVVTDQSWLTHLAVAWKPGQYKRWYLRALQEEFDGRLYPHGWSEPGYRPGTDWRESVELHCAANQPSLCATYPEYQTEIWRKPDGACLLERCIPMLREFRVDGFRLAETHRIRWKIPVEQYFDMVTPACFEQEAGTGVLETGMGEYTVDITPEVAVALTFELKEQIVGWPCFTVAAPAGTTVELLVHEAHAIGGPPLLNTHFHSWTRFICREGVNRFEPFDFESFRWVQLHIHGAAGKVILSDLHARRRVFPFLKAPQVRFSDQSLQRLVDASVNTLLNSAQETAVDGMARERQQYSGDGGHQLQALYPAFGDARLPARFIRTFGMGMTLDGYFFDCWPAYDRLARLMERQLGLTEWGPILDHGVGFNFDCWHYYMNTGDETPIREIFPNLARFLLYLESIQNTSGRLPVENLGVPSVWIDHDAYKLQRHKECAFNLYASGMLRLALAPLARALGETRVAGRAERLARSVLRATVSRYWDESRGLFVANRPWSKQEGEIRLCDRSLASSILFHQCPGGRVQGGAKTLADCPPEMGFSYPANAIWRLWALAQVGRSDVILHELRTRWATMSSVRLNNTIQEYWTVTPDSSWQWSHCAVGPLIILFQGILGLQPVKPGYTQYQIKPLPVDLESLAMTAYLPQGELRARWEGSSAVRHFLVRTPPGARGELILRPEEQVDLPVSAKGSGIIRYLLPEDSEVILRLHLI